MSAGVHPTPEQSDETGTAEGRRRRRLLVAALAALVVALVVLVLVLSNRDGEATDERADPAAARTTASTDASAAPSAADPSASGAAPGPSAAPETPVDADSPPPALDPVPLAADVDVEGIDGSLVLIEEIEGSAQGPGNINGPALRITVRLVNGTDGELSLSDVAVSAFHGADRTPASPLEDRSQSPFSGALPAGDAAEGVYVFRVPPDDRDDIRVEVGVRPGAAVMVFTGAV